MATEPWTKYWKGDLGKSVCSLLQYIAVGALSYKQCWTEVRCQTETSSPEGGKTDPSAATLRQNSYRQNRYRATDGTVYGLRQNTNRQNRQGNRWDCVWAQAENR
jgi:hypothetical protein